MELTVVPAPWMEADSKPWHLMPLPVWEGPGPINKEAWDTSYLLNILMSLAGVSTRFACFRRLLWSRWAAAFCQPAELPQTFFVTSATQIRHKRVAQTSFCEENDPNSSHTRRHYATSVRTRHVFVKKTNGFLHKRARECSNLFVKETSGFLHKQPSVPASNCRTGSRPTGPTAWRAVPGRHGRLFVKETTGFLHKQVAAFPGSFVKETIGFLHKNVSGANRGGVVVARV